MKRLAIINFNVYNLVSWDIKSTNLSYSLFKYFSSGVALIVIGE